MLFAIKMENTLFQRKVNQWLTNHDGVKQALWTLKEAADNQDSVIVEVNLIKTIIVRENHFSIAITGKSLTENTENAIQNAVIALNEDLLEVL